MADVASLGIQVTTQGTDRATAELGKVSGAAARAEAATEGLATANRGATGAASAAAQAYASEGAAAASASKQVELMKMAANGNSLAMKQAVEPSKNLAYQSRMVALQLSQVAQQTQASGNFIQALAIQLPDMATGFGTVGIAIGVLLGVMLPLIDAPKRIASGLRLLADHLQEIAPYAVAAAAALAFLYSPAIIGGVVQLIALLGRLVVQLGALAIAFAAANPALAFVIGITAAVAAANIFRDELAGIFGRDIVADAKNAVNFIINAFVGGFEALKATWKQLPAALGDLVYQAADGVVRGVEAMINGVGGKIDQWIGSINDKLQSLPEAVRPSWQLPKVGTVDLGGVTNPFQGRAAGVAGAAQRAYDTVQGRDTVGALGDMIAHGASKGAAALKDLAGWMEKVDTKAKKHHGKSEAELYSDIVDGANRRIASLHAEREALGLTEEAALKLRYETDLLNQAQQKGLTLTDPQKSQLAGLAEQMASLEYGTIKIKEAMDFAKDATKGFIDDFRSGLESGKGIWESFGDAALGVLDRITDKLLNEVLDAVSKVINSGSGSGGGIFGSILSALGLGGSSSFVTLPSVGPVPAVRPNALGGVYGGGLSQFSNKVVDNPTYFAFAKGVGLMGEAGPEAIMPLSRDSSGRLGVQATGLAANQNGTGTSQTGGQSVVRISLSPELVAQVLEQAQGQTVEIVKQNNKAREELYTNGSAR